MSPRDAAPAPEFVTAEQRAKHYPTERVMCSACSGTGQYDWDEIDVFTSCGTCGGVGEIEVCAYCHDSGEECDACGC